MLAQRRTVLHELMLLPAAAFPVLAGLAAVGCTDNGPPAYTQFPIPVDLGSGSVMVQVDIGDDIPLDALVDTLSPFTVLDDSTLGMMPEPIRSETLTLDITAAGAGPATTRARFSDVEVLHFHPCELDEDGIVPGLCLIGLDGNTRAINSIIGADLLSRNAVRFDFANATMSFFPDIVGEPDERGQLCEAMVDRPFYGGGTAIIGGAEVSVPGRRITVDGCFFRDPCDGLEGGPGCDEFCGVSKPTGTSEGVPSLFVLSTGLAPTIINRTTYDQYVYMHTQAGTQPAPIPYEDAESTILHLPAGPIEVRMLPMNDLALVAESSDERGPCEERYANDYLTRRQGCPEPGSPECPCPDDDDFCRAAAVAELRAPAGFEVAVVEDSEPILQALRNELRPGLPEVSGILGVDMLRALAVDVDYPNDRLFMRCMTGADCVIRPQVLSASQLEKTRPCLSEAYLGCLQSASPAP